MGTPIDYIKENNLEWQPAFNGALEVAGRYGYRGALVVTEGKMITAEKQMPPKVTIQQAIAISGEETMLFLAGKLESFDDFAAAHERYKSVLAPDTLVTLFFDDLMKDAVFEYEGITINAFALDESSVWNELLEHADLEKREVKRLGAEEKLDTLYDALLSASLSTVTNTYEETCSFKMS